MSKNSDETVNQTAEFDERGSPSVDSDSHPEKSGLFPVAPVWFSVGFYSLLFVWAGYLLYETFSFSAFEDSRVPFFMLSVVLILIPLKIVTVLFPEKTHRLRANNGTDSTEDIANQVENQSSDNSTKTKVEQERDELIMLAWVVALPFMMYVIGMGWSIILYVTGFVWYFTRDTKLVVSTTVGVTVFITVLFLNILGMSIWNGTLGLPDPLMYLNGQLEILLYRLFGI